MSNKDESAYKAWLQGMYQANCEERALYNEIPYKTIKEYEKANSEFLTRQWNQGVGKVL